MMSSGSNDPAEQFYLRVGQIALATLYMYVMSYLLDADRSEARTSHIANGGGA